MWSNLVRKEQQQQQPQQQQQQQEEPQQQQQQQQQQEREQQEVPEEGEDMGELGALMAQLSNFRERAEQMPTGSEERRAYAERVAVAFWEAMGGEEEDEEDGDR